jgi:Flp pilus assembly CpaF family ATPase
LKCSAPNVVRAFTGPMDARQLVKEFLRHNPDRIVVGELRDGGTADEWIGACNTGHPGGLSTAHANSAEEGLRRIATLIGKVVENVPYVDIVQAIDYVVYIEGKGPKRRVKEIVRPKDFINGRFVFKDEDDEE